VGRDADDGLYVADLASGGPGLRAVAPDSAATRVMPSSWSPDGSALLVTRIGKDERLSLFVARLAPARDAVTSYAPWRPSGSSDGWAGISPDGRWVTIESDQGGSREVFVAPLGSDLVPGRAFRVSDAGGGQGGEWLLGSRRLLYRSLDWSSGTIVDFGGAPHAGPDVKREPIDFDALGIGDQAAMPDGRILVVLRSPAERDDVPVLRVVEGWARDLDRRLAGGK